ncbi:MAG: hypothetical protein ACRBB0_05630 [Pelagimonas sp.]|uniref:hypothetical protein n=1 Tax=Pelagimonas sp. TaxID=2073170 RepID=UPI003D6ABBC1
MRFLLMLALMLAPAFALACGCDNSSKTDAQLRGEFEKIVPEGDVTVTYYPENCKILCSGTIQLDALAGPVELKVTASRVFVAFADGVTTLSVSLETDFLADFFVYDGPLDLDLSNDCPIVFGRSEVSATGTLTATGHLTHIDGKQAVFQLNGDSPSCLAAETIKKWSLRTIGGEIVEVVGSATTID